MHLATTFLLFVAGLSSVASSHSLHLESDAYLDVHFPVSRSTAIAHRQHRIRHTVADICISITGTAFLSHGRIVNTSLENLQLCVCLGDLDIRLDTDIHAQLFVIVFGRPFVKQILHEMLRGGVDSERCILPPHAQRICQIGVPCAFECQENYTEKDGKCACLLPFRDCNGVCDYFPDGCGTASPILARHKRQAISITTLVQAKHTCDINESVCGIPGREDTLDFECVDTSKTLDSCGGCVTPHPFYEAYRTTVKGVECGRQPGVITARCFDSQCVVSRCRKGQQPSEDKTVCVSTGFNLHQLVMERRTLKERRDRASKS